MPKILPLAIGLLAAISIAPTPQSLAANNIPSSHNTSGDLHAQIILKVRPQIQGGRNNRRGQAERRRQMELERERQAEARREAERRRSEYRRRH